MSLLHALRKIHARLPKTLSLHSFSLSATNFFQCWSVEYYIRLSVSLPFSLPPSFSNETLPFLFVGVSSTTSSPVSVRNEILTDERSLKRQPHTLPLVLFWFILSLNGSHLYELEYFIEDAIRVSIQCGLFPAYAELTQHPVGSQSSSTLPLPSIYTR